MAFIGQFKESLVSYDFNNLITVRSLIVLFMLIESNLRISI